MRPEDKRTHIEAWQTSGQMKAAYARQHKINSKTFNRWCVQYQPELPGEPGLSSVTILAVNRLTQATCDQIK